MRKVLKDGKIYFYERRKICDKWIWDSTIVQTDNELKAKELLNDYFNKL